MVDKPAIGKQYRRTATPQRKHTYRLSEFTTKAVKSKGVVIDVKEAVVLTRVGDDKPKGKKTLTVFLDHFKSDYSRVY